VQLTRFCHVHNQELLPALNAGVLVMLDGRVMRKPMCCPLEIFCPPRALTLAQVPHEFPQHFEVLGPRQIAICHNVTSLLHRLNVHVTRVFGLQAGEFAIRLEGRLAG
jgi:hypothetical protein